MARKKVKDKELQRLIELAYQLEKKEKGYHEIEDVKSMAEELGIAHDKVEKAYEMLQVEKERKAKRQGLIASYVIGMVFICLLVGSIIAYRYYANRPVPFEGNVIVSMASGVNKATVEPKDKLRKIRLFEREKLYCHLLLSDVRKNYQVRWKFYNPDGELYFETSKSIERGGGRKDDNYKIYTFLPVDVSMPVGDWQVEVYLDEQLIKEETFPIELGDYTIKMGTGVKDGQIKGANSVFSKADLEKVYCLINWAFLRHQGAIVWKWYRNDEFFNRGSYMAKPSEAGQSYWAYDSRKMINIKPGEWRVEAYLSDVKMGEAKFTLNP